MSLDQSRRLELFDWARDHMGAERAETLMEGLLPHPANELATKQDVAAIDARFDALDRRFDRFEDRFERLESELDEVRLRGAEFEHQLAAFGHQLDGFEHRFDGVQHQLEGFGHRIDALTIEIGARSDRALNRVLMWLLPVVVASIFGSVTLAATIAG